MKKMYLINVDHDQDFRALTYTQGLDFSYALKMKRKIDSFYNPLKQVCIQVI